MRSVRSVCVLSQVVPCAKNYSCYSRYSCSKKTCVQKNLVFKMMSVQDDEWFICGEWIHVIGVTHDRCDTWF